MKYMTMRALFKTKTVYFLHGIRKFFFHLAFRALNCIHNSLTII